MKILIFLCVLSAVSMRTPLQISVITFTMRHHNLEEWGVPPKASMLPQLPPYVRLKEIIELAHAQNLQHLEDSKIQYFGIIKHPRSPWASSWSACVKSSNAQSWLKSQVNHPIPQRKLFIFSLTLKSAFALYLVSCFGSGIAFPGNTALVRHIHIDRAEY